MMNNSDTQRQAKAYRTFGDRQSVVRWGLIGCGDISRKRVAPALSESPQSELAAVSRGNPDLLDEFANTFKVRHRFARWQELAQSEHIDAVYVATPPNLHAEQTIAAAESGKHVLCEKPMAMNVVECDRMIAAAEANGVKLGVAYYRQFYPVVKRMKDVIDSGEIGKPTILQVDAFEWVDPDPSDTRSWRLRPEIAGGGPMFEFGCHRIQLLLHLFGPTRVVSAITTNALFDREVDDTATASFEFADGIVATLSVSHAVMEPRDTFKIWGSEGSMSTEVLNEGTLTIKTRSNCRTETHKPAPNIHQPLVEDFVRAIIDHRQPLITGEIGKAVAQVEEEIYKQDA